MSTIYLHITQEQHVTALCKLLQIEQPNQARWLVTKDDYNTLIRSLRNSGNPGIVHIVTSCYRNIPSVKTADSIVHIREIALSAHLVFAYNPTAEGGLARTIVACRESLPEVPPLLQKEPLTRVPTSHKHLAKMLFASFEEHVEFINRLGTAGYTECLDNTLTVLKTAADAAVAEYAQKILDRIPAEGTVAITQEAIDALIQKAVEEERERCVAWIEKVWSISKGQMVTGIRHTDAATLLDI